MLRRLYIKDISNNNCVAVASSTILLFFILNVVYYYLAGIVFGLPYPRNSPLPLFLVHFGDFDAVYSSWRCCQFNSIGYGASYFPSLYLIANVFNTFGFKLSAAAHLISIVIFEILFVYYSMRKLHDWQSSIRDTAIIALFSYPFLFNVVTGNYEIYVFAFVATFFMLYRIHKYRLATFFLAFAISMKAFPIVFVLHIISRRRFIDILSIIFYGLLLTLLPLIIYDGGVTDGLASYLSRLEASQSMYKDLMYYTVSGVHYGNSLLNGLWALYGDQLPIKDMAIFWYLFAAAFFVFVAYRVFSLQYEDWEIALIATCLYCLLPTTSTDYKLIFFTIPLCLLFMSFSDNRALRIKPLPFILIILLLVSKSPVYFHSNPFFSLNTIANPLIMIMLLWCTLFPSKYLHWYSK